MLSNAPPSPRHDHDPAPLPDGSGESCARCALCGKPYIPQDARHTYCSQQCADKRRNAAHYLENATARQATVAVRRAGHDPSRIRVAWWLPGGNTANGQVVWLRRYYPSLYRLLCSWMPDARLHT